MERPSARGAGSAITWKAAQLGGTKLVFLIRILVLARLLSPDDFGLLAIATVAIGVSSRLTDLGMIPALVQSESTEERLYDVAWTVGMVRAVAIGVVVYLSAPLVADLFSDARAASLMRVLALQPMLEAVASIRVVDFIRKLNFRSVTLIRLPAAVSNTVVAIALAPSFGVWALVAGALAGPATSLVLSYVLAPYRPRISFDREAAQSLIRFGRWILLAGVTALVASTTLRFVISRQLGTVELGLYYLAASLAFLPSEIMSQVVGDVTFPMYSRLQDAQAAFARTFRSVFAATAALLVPSCLLLIALSPGLVEFALGEKWQGTVPIIQILGTVNIIGLLGENVGPVLKGAGRPNRMVAIEVVQSVIIISLAWIFTSSWGVQGAALAWIPAIAMSQLMSVRFVRQIIAHPFKGLGKILISVVASSVVGVLAAVWLFSRLPSFTGLVLAAVGSGLLIAGLLLILDRWLSLGLGQDIGRVFPQLAPLLAVFVTREDNK